MSFLIFGTTNINEVIIAAPIVAVALVIIASLLYCYYQRKGRKNDATKTAVQPVSKNSVENTLESSVWRKCINIEQLLHLALTL